MKIRTKLTVLFSLLTAMILLLFASIIYFSAQQNRETEFYSLLRKEALTKANVFFEGGVDAQVLQNIYQNNRKTLNEVEVAIYDTTFRLLYHDAVDIDFVKETKGMIDSVLKTGELKFYQKNWQVVALKFRFKNNDYVVTATAFDQYGYNKISNLLKSIVLVFSVAILVIFITGYFFSRKAFEPVKLMADKAKKISATNLDLRLDEKDGKDELAELARTFNAMLERLENSFDTQKHFVSNVSHELRTPLSAIITELELATGKDQRIEDYKAAIQNALSDARKLARLSHSLLDMAKASYDPSEISFKPLRIDEVMLDARKQVQQSFPGYRIEIRFENEFDNDEQISVIGNEYLLKVAFANLLENGCKFSNNKKCTASIRINETSITLDFTDNGIGISKKEIEQIFIPFYRGENRTYADGNGIGLSLTKKIIVMHKGRIAVTSIKNMETVFTVTLPSLNDEL